jgi:hypothetical protein
MCTGYFTMKRELSISLKWLLLAAVKYKYISKLLPIDTAVGRGFYKEFRKRAKKFPIYQ